MSEEEAARFIELTEKHPPGAGMIRTRRGGPILESNIDIPAVGTTARITDTASAHVGKTGPVTYSDENGVCVDLGLPDEYHPVFTHDQYKAKQEGVDAQDEYPGRGVCKKSGKLIKYKRGVDALGRPRVTIVHDGKPLTQYTDMAELKHDYALYPIRDKQESNWLGMRTTGEAEASESDTPITPETALQLHSGDIVHDDKGQEFAAMSARHNWIQVAPIVNGKPVVNADSLVVYHLFPASAYAYPHRQHDPLYATDRNAWSSDGKFKHERANQLGTRNE